MLFKQPPGGLPNVPHHYRMIARVPVYGTKDAGRKFWKKLRNTIIEKGLVENKIYHALYSYCDPETGELLALLGTHVDDILYCAAPGKGQEIVDSILGSFQCDEVKEKNFRYCGKEVRQVEDFTIYVFTKNNCEKLKPIKIRPGRKGSMRVDDHEKTQLKSIAGGLQWVARQARRELSYRTSKTQQFATTGTVSDIRFANKVVKYAVETADRGLTFRSGVIDWNKLAVVTVTDDSCLFWCAK